MTDEVDLLEVTRGTVVAPAGCGKTHSIGQTLAQHFAPKPVLVLTHTNAGVAALRGRLDRAEVPRQAYRLSTIDGWAMRLISLFPIRSAHQPEVLDISNPSSDYPRIREAASSLLVSGNISDVIQASYAHLIVDEYQDCSVRQHAVVCALADLLPCCLLGDPMQAIFGFGNDPLAHWTNDVCNSFKIEQELDKPWRWVNANSQTLGEWLLDVRAKLLVGEQIDLRDADAAVTWIELDGTEDHQRRLQAARVRPQRDSGRVLIIGDSRSADSRYQVASRTPGAVTVEAVDLRDLITFSRVFDPSQPDSLSRLVHFAQSVMVKVGASDLLRRVESLRRGTARKQASYAERVAVEFASHPSHQGAASLLSAISAQGGVRSHRPAVLKACLRALNLCSATEGLSFHDAAKQVREENRLVGRPIPKRAVGSTLLLKGLEAECSVILHADNLDARNLYVAMTRGSQSLTICSRTPVLNPAPPVF